MSNLVFVTGDFCSGSTLLFTLFRKTGEYYSLYEPLHERLLEYLIWPLPPDDHHFHVDNYQTELKGFDKIPQLFNPSWGTSELYLSADAQADELYRYLSYLIGTAFGRADKVMVKENRFTFRMGWLKAKFPQAKVVHIYRKKEDQWKSNLRRAQAWLGREDIGQNDVNYNGFAIANWCEDLKRTFPELGAENFDNGFDRFAKLWELCLAENQRYADISVDYWALTHQFEETCEKIVAAIGASGIDIASLKDFVVPPEKHKPTALRPGSIAEQMKVWINRGGRKYARLRVEAALRRRNRETVPAR
jgi:hypothetical protein